MSAIPSIQSSPFPTSFPTHSVERDFAPEVKEEKNEYDQCGVQYSWDENYGNGHRGTCICSIIKIAKPHFQITPEIEKMFIDLPLELSDEEIKLLLPEFYAITQHGDYPSMVRFLKNSDFFPTCPKNESMEDKSLNAYFALQFAQNVINQVIQDDTEDNAARKILFYVDYINKNYGLQPTLDTIDQVASNCIKNTTAQKIFFHFNYTMELLLQSYQENPVSCMEIFSEKLSSLHESPKSGQYNVYDHLIYTFEQRKNIFEWFGFCNDKVIKWSKKEYNAFQASYTQYCQDKDHDAFEIVIDTLRLEHRDAARDLMTVCVLANSPLRHQVMVQNYMKVPDPIE